MNTGPATPGVRIPPPVVFLLSLAAGWALDRWLFAWPLLEEQRRHWLDLHAFAIGGVAIWLIGGALGRFRRQGTDPRPWREDSALVVGGIYRHTRNPMYVGMALVQVAITFALNSLWPLLTLVPALLVIRWYVIAREEAYLAQRFGADYADYCAKVRRWI